MKLLHFDSTGGASGDMILGALIALGVDPEALNQALASLNVDGIHIHAEPASDRGIHGIRASVHTHDGAGSHHHHGDEADHHHHDQPSRNLADIRAIINGSDLPEPVKQISLEVFEHIGEAEAKIHGTTPGDIHFHEVGALDSIADIVGCCLGLHLLKIDGVSVSPLPMGHGVIECAHGTYPNPAPATVELLRGMPTEHVDEPHELVTPTGAALFSVWKTHDTPPPGSRVVQSGYSIGGRKLKSRSNALRATLYESAGDDAAPATCRVLECNLDDITPELVGVLTERLLRAGALDVFTTPVQMKKQRPGILLTVLCRHADREAMLDLIFTESTTFGVRETTTQRTVLERRTETVKTPYGDVRVKIGTWKGRDVTVSPEMDDCLARAEEHGVPVRAVYEAALRIQSVPM